MFQTAHQSAAAAGNFSRIEGKPLFLCHFNGNWLKFAQKALAAKFPSANTNTAEDFCLVPHADLTQFNACPENCSQILDQIPEIHTIFSGKIEQQFAVIKRTFYFNQFHFEFPHRNFFFADVECTNFFFAILFQCFTILFVDRSQNLFQRLHNGSLLNGFVGDGDFSAFRPFGRFHDHKVTCLKLVVAGEK